MDEKPKIKILIVDDHKPSRQMIRRYLSSINGEFCECASSMDVFAAYRDFLPDWVLMDWEMKQTDGLEASRRIINEFPEARILMVTQYSDAELRQAVIEAGVSGFFQKDNLLELSEFFKNLIGQ